MKRGLVWLLAVAATLWVGDWTVWQLKVARGGGYDSVQVDLLLKTPLKNHKEEFDDMGIAPQACVRALFPHNDDKPCWWVRRHTTQWE